MTHGGQTTSELREQAAQNRAAGVLDEYLTRSEAAHELRKCTKTLERWAQLGIGPPITRLGKDVLYRRSSLHKWLVEQEQAA
jgi:hypothetical protein